MARVNLRELPIRGLVGANDKVESMDHGSTGRTD
jgi:hypothetical protein